MVQFSSLSFIKILSVIFSTVRLSFSLFSVINITIYLIRVFFILLFKIFRSLNLNYHSFISLIVNIYFSSFIRHRGIPQTLSQNFPLQTHSVALPSLTNSFPLSTHSVAQPSLPRVLQIQGAVGQSSIKVDVTGEAPKREEQNEATKLPVS